jgi:hypothetical protein
LVGHPRRSSPRVRRRALLRTRGAAGLEPTRARHRRDSFRTRLLAARLRRRHLHLRRRAFLRLDRRAAPQPARRRHARDEHRAGLLAGKISRARRSSTWPRSSARSAASPTSRSPGSSPNPRAA